MDYVIFPSQYKCENLRSRLFDSKFCALMPSYISLRPQDIDTKLPSILIMWTNTLQERKQRRKTPVSLIKQPVEEAEQTWFQRWVKCGQEGEGPSTLIFLKDSLTRVCRCANSSNCEHQTHAEFCIINYIPIKLLLQHCHKSCNIIYVYGDEQGLPRKIKG